MSKPSGDKISTRVARMLTAITEGIFAETHKKFIDEKISRLRARLEKLINSIAADPSKLFSEKTVNFLRPYFSPTIAAPLSPYAIGKIPAATTSARELKKPAKIVYEIA